MLNQLKVFIPGIFVSGTAAACPFCHSTTAEEVRAGIIATAQDANVLMAMLGPFLVLCAILAWLARAEGETNTNRERRKP